MLDNDRPQRQRRREFLRRRFCADILPALIAATLIPGCSAVGTLPTASSLASSALPARFFTLKGRISVRAGDRLETGKVHWIKLPGEERVQLFTPFGNQVAELVMITGGPVTLQRGQEIITAPTMNELTATLLGVNLDMDAVAAWTQGIGLKDGDEADQMFANGEAWRVTAERIQTQGPHQFASRLIAIRGDTVVRLVIDEWRAERQ